MKQRVVHLKQSGELLTDVAGVRWTLSALKRSAARLGEVQRRASELGVLGLLVVSGGGNVPDGFGRGANTRAQFGEGSKVAHYADVIGRRSTVDNSIMLAAALEDAGVPYLLLAAPNSAFNDVELGSIKEYSPALVQAAYGHGKIVIMAGGTGKAGQTTDAAVVEYAMWQAQAFPGVPSIALKSTKFNGVFEGDPAKVPDTKRYKTISAADMLANYERLGAVDRRCLEILQEAGRENLDVRLQIYAAEHSIATALEDPGLGTIVQSFAVPASLA